MHVYKSHMKKHNQKSSLKEAWATKHKRQSISDKSQETRQMGIEHVLWITWVKQQINQFNILIGLVVTHKSFLSVGKWATDKDN